MNINNYLNRLMNKNGLHMLSFSLAFLVSSNAHAMLSRPSELIKLPNLAALSDRNSQIAAIVENFKTNAAFQAVEDYKAANPHIDLKEDLSDVATGAMFGIVVTPALTVIYLLSRLVSMTYH